ncbi:hypothetical protein L228DRAFT_153258 [Xylona heveae TC161]|uniref:Uncharacterized protein n=1 Tax=Xylona heveae (strain CBS 132557 / TC161) TaxID=1328760 RepID=A0A165GPZ2_XYLHT|nr:hypothetical protein L228DRAFT_153258 [Xylona heveae TC161]KZF22452.1 hypothetical protein L228DRAFT_153258 [Xylona heveae TC161]
MTSGGLSHYVNASLTVQIIGHNNFRDPAHRNLPCSTTLSGKVYDINSDRASCKMVRIRGMSPIRHSGYRFYGATQHMQPPQRKSDAFEQCNCILIELAPCFSAEDFFFLSSRSSIPPAYVCSPPMSISGCTCCNLYLEICLLQPQPWDRDELIHQHERQKS